MKVTAQGLASASIAWTPGEVAVADASKNVENWTKRANEHSKCIVGTRSFDLAAGP